MHKLSKIILSLFMISLPFSLYAFRDPTQPPLNIQAQTIMSPSAFTLNGIITNGENKLAVINGLYKKIGDEVLGERVTRIGENTVQLEGPNGKMTLFLFGQPVKDLGQVQCKKELDLCMDAKY